MLNKAKYVLLATLVLLGCQFTHVQALTYSEITNTGTVLGGSANGFYPYPTGTLVNDNGTVYFISSTTKVPFTNWQAFVGLGYEAKNIVDGDLTNYTPASSYTINTANAEHPWGSWLIYKGTVYYSTQDGLIGVPSVQAFTSNGGDWTYIVKANSYDIAALNANPNLQILAVNDSRITTTPTYQFGSNPGQQTPSSNNNSVINISTTALPAATINTAYSASVNFNYTGSNNLSVNWTGLPGGVGGQSSVVNPANFNVAGNPNTLTLSGTPTQSGVFNIAVTITDSSGVSASQNFTLNVNTTASNTTAQNIAAANSSTSPITVTAPSGGTYSVGSPLTINWTSVDYGLNGSKHVDINLLTYDPNSSARNLITTIAPALYQTGSYSWSIPSSITPGQYIIRVSSSETGEQVWGFSQPFTITAGTATQTAPLSVTKNPAFTDQTIAPNTSGAKIGSFILKNQGSEDIKVTSLGFDIVQPDGTILYSSSLINLRTSETSAGVIANTMNYNTFPVNFIVAAGGSKTIDLYADILSTYNGSFTAIGAVANAVGISSNTVIKQNSDGLPVAGQIINVSGAPAH